MSAIDKARLQLSKCAKCVGCELLNNDSFRGNDNCIKFVDCSTKKEDLVNEYNNTLTRLYKATKFVDGPETEIITRKYLPEFRKLLKRLEEILWDFKVKGYNITQTEILEGFKEGLEC